MGWLTIIIGLFVGFIFCEIVLNVILFDIPLTLKLKKMGFVNKFEIMKGSFTSIILSFLILLIGWFLTHYLFGAELSRYLFALISAGLFSFFKEPKSNKMKLYFEKHVSNISPTLSILAYNKNGFDYQGIISYLRIFLPHSF